MILISFLFLSFSWGSMPKQVHIPSGDFTPAFRDLGEEKVHIESLWVDPAPVTNQEYLSFLKEHTRWQKNKIAKIYADEGYLKHWLSELSFSENEAHFPVVNISWFAAREYCRVQGKRLPTLSEWEYFSDTVTSEYEKKALAWYSKAKEELRSVRQEGPNRFGLYDTHSLVWEWVEDYFSVFMMADSRQSFTKDMFCAGAAIGTKDPSKYATFVRYAMRASLKGASTGSRLGFRCVKSKGDK